MDTAGIHTRKEILSQPEVWAQAIQALKEQAPSLAAFYRQGRYAQVVFTGCGSTYYLALAAASLFQELAGLPARGLPASEIWLSPNAIPQVGPAVSKAGAAIASPGKTLLVAVSRSGETTETIRACQGYLAQGGDLLTLTCAAESRLAALGRQNLVFPAAMETSIAQTRAFSTLYLATAFLAALWAGRSDLLAEIDRLPEAGKRLLDVCEEPAARLGQDRSLDRFYFLGSGPRYGLACELSLKMKEMSLSHSEPFHFLEFRHGPMSMVTGSTLIVGLLSASHHEQEAAVLNEMTGRGAKVYRLGEAQAEAARLDCAFQSGVSEAMRNVLYLPPGQLLAFERALSRGLDPDHPQHLEAVVRL